MQSAGKAFFYALGKIKAGGQARDAVIWLPALAYGAQECLMLSHQAIMALAKYSAGPDAIFVDGKFCLFDMPAFARSVKNVGFPSRASCVVAEKDGARMILPMHQSGKAMHSVSTAGNPVWQPALHENECVQGMDAVGAEPGASAEQRGFSALILVEGHFR